MRSTLYVCIYSFILAGFALSGAPGLLAQTPLTTEQVAAGFTEPLYVTSPAGDFDRLFVVEQGGKIKIIKDGVVLATPFIDLTTKVKQTGNERGLLGLAFHPDYASNGYFYVSYTRISDGASMVERYTVSGINPDLADAGSNVTILGPVTQPYSNHNGGCIQFGWDGKLYVGLGDGGSADDPECRAQDKTTLLGKMLRLNDDGTAPVDNPFVLDATVPNEIWALGLRNPWRFSFDWATGDLYIGDVGQNVREEINFQGSTSMGGENYGWRVMEGTNCFDDSDCLPAPPVCNDPALTLPFQEYNHSGGKCSITGGYVYRGCAIPDLEGTYFYADYCTAQIWSLRYDGATITDFQERTGELAPGGGFSINQITSFGEDAEGEIYIVDRGGEIFKIVADAPAPYEDLGFSKPGTGGIAPELEVCGLLGSGDTAQAHLRKARPLAVALLVYAPTSTPFPVFGGTLIPDPIFLKIINTSADGSWSATIMGGNGPKDIYAQILVDDPGATQNVAFSNAVKIIKQP